METLSVELARCAARLDLAKPRLGFVRESASPHAVVRPAEQNDPQVGGGVVDGLRVAAANTAASVFQGMGCHGRECHLLLLLCERISGDLFAADDGKDGELYLNGSSAGSVAIAVGISEITDEP